jgi:hypothetical protein
MGRVFIRSDHVRTVSIIAGKTHAMDEGAHRVLNSVRAAAARHTDTGAYQSHLGIVTVPGRLGTGRLVDDRLVVADDPGAAAIEYGHLIRVKGARRVKWVPGLHIMRDGMRAALI